MPDTPRLVPCAGFSCTRVGPRRYCCTNCRRYGMNHGRTCDARLRVQQRAAWEACPVCAASTPHGHLSPVLPPE